MTSSAANGPSDARVRAEVAEFLSSPHGTRFSNDRAGAGEVARAFLQVCYDALGMRVDLLDEEHLREAFLERLPQRLDRSSPATARATEIVRALLAWAHEIRPNPSSWKLDGLLDELAEQFPARLARRGGRDVVPDSAPITRPGSKLGRNDPCPCGSGKKWKKCCGANASG